MSKAAIICLSGGMDSATLPIKAKEQGHDILYGVSFTYGSKHNEYELQSACMLAKFFKMNYHAVIDLESTFDGFNSNLLKRGGPIPEGHYEEKSMEQTVVPGRNMIFISYLTGLAWSQGAESIYIGVHSGDHAIYPDCRPEFMAHMAGAVYEGSGRRVRLHAPFLRLDKAAILKIGIPAGVPYNLTRTCYKDQPIACGKCGACQERLEAFAKIGEPDPIQYMTTYEGKPVDGTIRLPDGSPAFPEDDGGPTQDDEGSFWEDDE